MIARGSCTGGGATNLQGIAVPIEPRQSLAPASARIEAAEDRAAQNTRTQRMPLEGARQAVSAEQRKNIQLQAQIKKLQAQIDQQADPATLIAAQQDNVALQAKVDDLDQQLQGARERITALESRAVRAESDLQLERQSKAPQIDQVPAPRRSRRKASKSEVVLAPQCAGGCGRMVAAEYVERTGRTWHGPCEASVPAEVRAAAEQGRGAA
jgi:predicted RNase H-like nuclease (RuvC/YqgF family)